MSNDSQHPEVSVILPFYNAENTLGEAANSIIKQTFQDFELLLIDNNSTDKSSEIACNIALRDSRVQVLHESNQGVVHAMNRGLEKSRGKFIVRMDADDISHNTRIQKQLNYLKANTEIGLLGTEVEYVPHNKNTAGFSRFVDWLNSFHSPEEIEKKCFIEIPVVNPSLMFRRELFEKYGGCKDGDFPEDYEMQLRYLSKGVKMVKLPEVLLEWHDYSSRLARTDNRYSTDAFFKTKSMYFRKWSKKYNPFHPNIWVWGSGRKTRQRCSFLKQEGFKTNGFIDIVKGKENVTFYKDIPNPGKMFIVSMVTNTGAGEQIREFLLERNYVEGKHFILMG